MALWEKFISAGMSMKYILYLLRQWKGGMPTWMIFSQVHWHANSDFHDAEGKEGDGGEYTEERLFTNE